jgi:hypothetical protein
MKQKKENFFKRLKNAVTNFDKYREYADEKVSVATKYILKLVLIFSIIIAVSLTIRTALELNRVIESFRESCPDFKIENNSLVMQEENNNFTISDSSNTLCLIINSEKQSLTEIEEANNYQSIIAILKDKIVLRNSFSMESSTTYEQLGETYELNNITKQGILSYITSENIAKLFLTLIIIFTIYMFIEYLIQILLDIIILSIIGFLFSRIIGIKFKYKQIFNMSVYAITLSFLLYIIYVVVNIFTGFIINYFEVAYNAIAYIYIMTAMMMIKSDLTKEKVMVGKIVQEQKKVREENKTEEENRDEEDKKEEKQKEKKEKKRKEKEKQGETPEGSNA